MKKILVPIDDIGLNIYSNKENLLEELYKLLYPYYVDLKNINIDYRFINVSIIESTKMFYKYVNDLNNRKYIPIYVLDSEIKVHRSDKNELIIAFNYLQNMVMLLHTDMTLTLIISNEDLGLYDINRLIRALNCASLEKRCIKLHGSAIALDDQAIVFTGKKFAGKTTSMLQSIKILKKLKRTVQFISNDDIFISKNYVWGTNRSVSIRQITFDMLNFSPPNSTYQLPIQDRNAQWKRKYRYKPVELMENLNIKILHCAPIKKVVLLEHSYQSPLVKYNYYASYSDLQNAVLPKMKNNILCNYENNEKKEIKNTLKECSFSYIRCNESNILETINKYWKLVMQNE